MTLTEFLLARIAEDEEVAERAGIRPGSKPAPPLRWVVAGREAMDHDTHVARVETEDGDSSVAGDELGDEVILAEDAEHIARWDPARALAECEAKRRIVERHTLKSEEHGWRRPPPICAECGGADWRPDALGMLESHPWAMPWPCPTLCLLALPYADHPDYDEAWRP